MITEYLFARWIVMHYSSDYLNEITGEKWKQYYDYFQKNVLTNINKGNIEEHELFLKDPNIKPQEFIIKEVIKEIPLKTIYVKYESNGCDCGQISCPICY
jgi:hypothetical protein